MKILQVAVLASAFCSAFVLSPSDTFAFKAGDHQNITYEALKDLIKNKRRMAYLESVNRKTDSIEFYVSEAHFDNELFEKSSKRLIQFKEDAIDAYIEKRQTDGDELLGRALHTLQDFYSHSNWVEMEQSTHNAELGILNLINPSDSDVFCTDNSSKLTELGKTKLTSGYWPGGPFGGCEPIPAHKCYHGSFTCNGINKDKSTTSGYDSAYEFALDATQDYFKQIQVHSPTDSFSYNNGTLGVVIDDTGSMSGSIEQVKTQVEKIVNSTKNKITAPEEYLLVRFGDPDVGPPFKSNDSSSFLDKVNSLNAAGGGDCPEFSQQALLQAIGASRQSSNLYLFTDASAKDGNLAKSVNAAAQAKKISITAVLSGTCSPVDPAYISNTLSTGGQLFLVEPSEVGSIFDLITPQLTGDLVTILQMRGSLDSIPEPHSREMIIPVDSTITRLVVAVLTDTANSVKLTTPSNSTVNSGHPATKIANLSSGIIFTIDNPEIGEWKFTLSGTGDYSVAVQGNSELDIYQFDFVKLINYRTPLYEPISGQPVRGSSSTALASLIGPYSSATFWLIDEFGNDLMPIVMSMGDPDAAGNEFVGTFTLPNVPFRVRVSGVDNNTKQYERQLPKIFNAQTVQVASDSSNVFSPLPRGTTTTLKFEITNFGEPDSFDLLAVNNLSFAQVVRPNPINLGNNETQIVEVDVVVPSEVSDVSNLLMTVTATSASNNDLTNSATVILPISDGLDKIPPSLEVTLTPNILWPMNHKMVPINARLTVTDAQDPNPSVILSSIKVADGGKVLSDKIASSNIKDATYGTDDRAFSLRAIRSSYHQDRTYTVTYSATDASGNTRDTTATIIVPSPKNGKCGPVVGGSCSTSISPSSPELCSVGKVYAFINTPAGWIWKCSGEYGGFLSACTEKRCK